MKPLKFTWLGSINMLLALYTDSKQDKQKLRQEFFKMAMAADRYNELCAHQKIDDETACAAHSYFFDKSPNGTQDEYKYFYDGMEYILKQVFKEPDT